MTIGIALILVAVLLRRLFIRDFTMESIFSFLGGFIIIVVSVVIFKVIFKSKIKK